MDTVYYTPQEVAERLRLRVQTVYDYIRKGRLPAVRLGNRCRIAAADLEAFLSRPDAVSSPAGETQAMRNAAARRLLAEWMADNSGYDEQVWPMVERLLEENPVSFGDSRP